jgi:hypothetical protein
MVRGLGERCVWDALIGERWMEEVFLEGVLLVVLGGYFCACEGAILVTLRRVYCKQGSECCAIVASERCL